MINKKIALLTQIFKVLVWAPKLVKIYTIVT